MSGDQITDLGTIDAPYGRQIVLQEVAYASGMTLLRLRIREGTRFTILELDAKSAGRWARIMSVWATDQSNKKPSTTATDLERIYPLKVEIE